MSDDSDNQLVESGEESQEEGSGVSFLDDLKGPLPKIMGYDYYSVIYMTAAALGTVMLFLYNVFEEPELKKMVAIQGTLSVGMLFSAMYFRSRVADGVEEDRLEAKAAKDAAASKAKKGKGKRKRK